MHVHVLLSTPFLPPSSLPLSLPPSLLLPPSPSPSPGLLPAPTPPLATPLMTLSPPPTSVPAPVPVPGSKTGLHTVPSTATPAPLVALGTAPVIHHVTDYTICWSCDYLSRSCDSKLCLQCMSCDYIYKVLLLVTSALLEICFILLQEPMCSY